MQLPHIAYEENIETKKKKQIPHNATVIWGKRFLLSKMVFFGLLCK
jgi:hypothetical protein